MFFDTISYSTYNQRLIVFLSSQKERYSTLRKNARRPKNTNLFSSCDVILPKLSLSYGKRNSLKTPRRGRVLLELTSLFTFSEEAHCEALLDDADGAVFRA